MYGLRPDDLHHLEQLCGQQVTQVAVGQFQIVFATGPSPGWCISVEGRCELLDPSGKVADSWDRGQRSRDFLFLNQLGKTIAAVKIDTPTSFLAKLDDGWSLRFIDNSALYESFSVGGLYV